MIPIATPFPHVGSTAFDRETGDQLTIIRRNPDGSAFCRRENRPRASFTRGGPASGNATFAAANLVETFEETDAIKKPTRARRANARSRRSNAGATA